MRNDRQQAHYWTEFGDEISPRSVKDRASWHEQRRHRIVAEILLELYLMSATEVFPKTVKCVSLLKARWQDANVSEEDKEFARCAPRQIIVYSKPAQDLMRQTLPRRADHLRILFSSGDTLPAIFNATDSLCEEKGLVEAFKDASDMIIKKGQETNGKVKYQQLTVDVKNAFTFYRLKARDTYMICVEMLEKKLIFPKPLPENERKWKQQLLIVQSYSKSLHASGSLNTVSEFDRIERLIKTYQNASKKSK